MKRAVSALAALAVCAHAQEVSDDPAVEVGEPEIFEAPVPSAAHFFETFSPGFTDQWKHSNSDDFPGRFEEKVSEVLIGEHSLVTVSKGQRYAISAAIQPAFDSSKQGGLTVQYEVKLNDGLTCGGAYIKLLAAQEDAAFQPEEFNNETPFSLMFGPDKCGSTDKVHVIFRHRNPISGEWEEKHLTSPPKIKSDHVETHLYTVVVRPDNTGQILIDGVEAKAFDLRTDFEPPFQPAELVDDETDSKPEDWVDEAKIVDPDATKPDDWDEDAPRTVPDLDATMPDGWLEDEADEIDDPEAQMPDDWDVEADGEFEAPLIPNPKCASAPGCGPWTRPQKRNPDFKGKWEAPFIDNPAYKGEWAPRKVPNPHYFVEENPAASIAPASGIGFDILAMNERVEFDNIFVGFDAAEAKQWASETWQVKRDAEIEANKKARASSSDSEQDGLEKVIGWFADNIVIVVVTALLGFFGVLWAMFRGSDDEFAPAPATPTTQPAQEEADSDDKHDDKSDSKATIAEAQDDEEDSAAKKDAKQPKRRTSRKNRRAD